MALLAIRLIFVFVVGTCLGSFVNWAIYSLAWSPRPISPWSRGPTGVQPRRWADRVPIFGWFALKREAAVHGARFWWRPMLLELAIGVALAALYWWDVEKVGLIREQVPGLALQPPGWPVHWQFLSQAILLCWMVPASFIDIDEKIIPDEITVTGTLLGLLLATLVPMSVLPNVEERAAQPLVGERLANAAGIAAVGPNGISLWLEPVTGAAPIAWPPAWAVPGTWTSLVAALACYWLWCFALAPRIWRGRRGPLFALRLIAARVYREFLRPPLRWLLMSGTAGIVIVWAIAATGWPMAQPAWAGLLTALVGLVGSGGIVWAVRLIGTAALRREAMGFGDVLLMMMIGTFLGWQACLIAFFLAPLAGLVIGIAQLILRRDDVIPYGPFLCLGSATTVVFWAPIWIWAKPFFAAGVLDALPPGVQAPAWLQPFLGAGSLVILVIAVCLVMLGVMLWIWRMIKTALFGQETADD